MTLRFYAHSTFTGQFSSNIYVKNQVFRNKKRKTTADISALNSRLRFNTLVLFNLVGIVYIIFLQIANSVILGPIMLACNSRDGKKFVLNNTYVPLVYIQFNVKPYSIFKKTIQRSPMAHRQWSQEQYGSRIFKYDIIINTNINFLYLSPKIDLWLFGFDSACVAPVFLYNSSFLNNFRTTLNIPLNLLIS